MSILVQINNKQLMIKEFKGQRVITFKDIDTVHERPEGTAKRNFNANKEHFLANEDYYFVKPADAQKYGFRTSEINNAGTYLITESGYLMLVKSLNDDTAWKIQRELVNSYFRVKEIQQSPGNGMKIINLIHEEVGQLIAETNKISGRVETLENTMTIDYGQQLTLQNIAKEKAIKAMGGTDSLSYKDKGLRGKVFSQVWKDYKDYFQVNSYKNTAKIDYTKAKEYLQGWKVQGKLLREIEDANNQISLKGEAV